MWCSKRSRTRKGHTMELAAAKHLAETLMTEHDLLSAGWSFTFDNASRRMGVCRYKTKTIGVSRLYAAEATEAQVRDTILHEIAHAIVGPSHKHGLVWKAAASRIGATPKSCGDNPYAQRQRDESVASATAVARSVPVGSARDLTSRAQPGERVVILPGVIRPTPGTVMVVTAANRTRYVVSDPSGKLWAMPFTGVRLHVDGEDLVRTTPRHTSMTTHTTPGTQTPPARHPSLPPRVGVLYLRSGETGVITSGKYKGARFEVARKNPTTYTGTLVDHGFDARVPHSMLRRAA